MDSVLTIPFNIPVFNNTVDIDLGRYYFEGDDESVHFDALAYEEDRAVADASVYAADSSANFSSVSNDILWLINLCQEYLKSAANSVFNTFQLCEEIIKVAQAERSDDVLQTKLYELFGDEGFEPMLQILQNIDAVKGFRTADLQLYKADQEFQNLSLQQKKTNKRAQRNQPGNTSTSDGQSSQALDWLAGTGGFTDDYLETERRLGLQGGAARGNGSDNWRDNLAPAGSREYYEKKSSLPAGATKTFGTGFEEIHVPAQKKANPLPPAGLVAVESMEEWAQKAFPGTKMLNRIQSEVYNAAYCSAENLLICAPTGAGKTNIAMLSFLQLIKQNIHEGRLDKDSIKAVYIAPMKALAQEVVSKFKERLQPLGLVVKEYTGDMQLTKQEVADSHLLVCTPEKYDVVTRKGGEGSLGNSVSLIIIDEVHLLADERGAVIETIVARTQRYVESAQRMVRIVGLSATLPNYQDVASFLRVNPTTGLFFFGPEFRPVPLEQTYVGVTETQKFKQKNVMNRIAYEKMVAALTRGKQVMIFVHSRKETGASAEAIREFCAKNGTTDLLENIHHEKFTIWKKAVDKSRNKEVQQLYYQGMGIHHAGMLRSDRTMTEELFEQGLIKVLFCTATLAWGVNLPAHTVIIKGTEMYDPERGGLVDVSVLDIVQIFGRAGRPQYDNSGHAILITSQKSMNNYLSLLSLQTPIESNFIKALADHLNAEIVNGTVNNVREGCSWLTHTFLFVRMCRNPMSYGMNYEERFADPQLEKKRTELITTAAKVLDHCMMARFDPRSGNLACTDLGRIASHYYIKHSTIEAFNSMLSAHLNEPDALHVLCCSSEFDQLKLRPEELDEIDHLRHEASIEIKGSVDETSSKVNVLLQGYLNQSRLTSFTLQSDTNFISQNASRICRALFEIALKRGWSTLANQYLSLCKYIDQRIRPDQCILRQFSYHDDVLPRDVLKQLETHQLNTGSSKKNQLLDLLDMNATEVGQFVHSNHKIGSKILSLIRKLPYLQVECVPQPLTPSVMKLALTIWCGFEWTDRYHGKAESFYIWVEDGNSEHIYHSEKFVLFKPSSVARALRESFRLEFIIPISNPLPPQYYLRVISDKWVGCYSLIPISFQHLILPNQYATHTNLLDVHPIAVAALHNPLYERLYSSKFTHFNPLQSQLFHTLYHSDVNMLVGAPTGSGKTITAELALLRLHTERPQAKAIYVAPLKALARERLQDWQRKLGDALNFSILELTGDVTPESSALDQANLLIVTPEKWDSISRGWQKRAYVQKVELVIIDEIHLLGVERGAVLEIIVSRMRFISAQLQHPIRFVGLSTALANPRDLGDWLGIQGNVGIYNFRPSVRPIPMTIYIQGFPGPAYCPRMATMNKPAYAAIKEHSPTKPVLIFVSSRRQTRLTALDLISYCAGDDNPRQFLHMPTDDDEEITALAATFHDEALRNCIVFGIGIHHAGLDAYDRNTVESLYLSNKIQILVCTATLAWGVNLPCHLVIVKGTEFFDTKSGRYVDMPVTDILQMIGRAGRPQFDTTGVACVFVHEPKKNFYKKFLHEPFPVESSLFTQLHEHFNAEISIGIISSLQDCIEYLSWTYYFRRLVMNPSYYGLIGDYSPVGIQKHLTSLVTRVLTDLVAAECIQMVDDDRTAGQGVPNANLEGVMYSSTPLGQICSYYYLNYQTIGQLKRGIVTLFHASENDNNIIRDVIHLLCHAPEFSEIPVRHNEDILNADLSALCPWPLIINSCSDQENYGIPADSFGGANSKAYLLIQAHLGKITLPIIDYVNDTKSVLDQFPRVLNAAIDLCCTEEVGSLRAVLALTTVSKMIYQACNVDVDELSQLPFTERDRQLLRNKGIKTVMELHSRLLSTAKESADGDHGATAAVSAAATESENDKRHKRGSDRGLGGAGRGGASTGELDLLTRADVSKALAALPKLTIHIETAANNTSDGPVIKELTAVNYRWPLVVGSHQASESATNAEVVATARSIRKLVSFGVRIQKTRTGFPLHRSSRGGSRQQTENNTIYSPRYHKPKTMSWWLIVYSAADNSLLALKKLVLGKETTVTNVQCEVPLNTLASESGEGAGQGTAELTLYLISDCAFGIDQRVQFTLVA
jgi:activating signal cointegrator complex subunit 3